MQPARALVLTLLLLNMPAACGGRAVSADAGAGGGHDGSAADAAAAGQGGHAGGAGTGGSGGAGGSSYACGSETCVSGQTFCYSFTGGVPGAGTSRSCMTLPAACATKPTCACVCPPSSSPAIGCSFEGGSSSYCSCTETNGALTVSCAGA